MHHGIYEIPPFDLHLPTAVECLSDILLDSLLSIKCLEEVDWKTLLAYDSQVFGFPRHAFLSKWLCAQGSHTLVTVSNEGSVVGYVVVRPTFIKQDGFKIGPLFADWEPIAEMLLKTVFKSVFFQQGAATTSTSRLYWHLLRKRKTACFKATRKNRF